MMYARGKTYTIKHWLKGAPEIWAGLHDQCQNGDLMNKRIRMKLDRSLQRNRVARSFEFTHHSSIVGIPVGNNMGTKKEW